MGKKEGIEGRNRIIIKEREEPQDDSDMSGSEDN